jgi:Na+/H+ antiporter NhaD/arsenite permease-like protein
LLQACGRRDPTGVTALVLVVFAAVYLGMAIGRWPGLKVDRTGIALLGAILLYGSGAVDGAAVLAAIDFPTLIILFGLMILSAQFAACGFYDWCSARIATAAVPPAGLLAITVAAAGLLSAVLANDVVVFAMTPMLCAGLVRRGLDPRPFVIALAGGANAGSAATIIGNPQNILIGEVGQLEFWPFLIACAPPALAGLASVFLVVWWLWRKCFVARATPAEGIPPRAPDRAGLVKAAVATLLLLVLFATPLPHVEGVLLVAGFLLISRRLASRTTLGLVDWHLLVLFGGLFVVTAALARTGLPDAAVLWLDARGLAIDGLAVLAPLTLIGANTIGNVPLVVLLLSVAPAMSEGTFYALAVLSTLAGNLLVVGSLANIIAVERARDAGVVLTFAEHAGCGVPMTLLSLLLALAWLYAMGYADF